MSLTKILHWWMLSLLFSLKLPHQFVSFILLKTLELIKCITGCRVKSKDVKVDGMIEERHSIICRTLITELNNHKGDYSQYLNLRNILKILWMVCTFPRNNRGIAPKDMLLILVDISHINATCYNNVVELTKHANGLYDTSFQSEIIHHLTKISTHYVYWLHPRSLC